MHLEVIFSWIKSNVNHCYPSVNTDFKNQVYPGGKVWKLINDMVAKDTSMVNTAATVSSPFQI